MMACQVLPTFLRGLLAIAIGYGVVTRMEARGHVQAVEPSATNSSPSRTPKLSSRAAGLSAMSRKPKWPPGLLQRLVRRSHNPLQVTTRLPHAPCAG
jgi:hypothetical protein